MLIGGKPARRALIDMHACPLSDGPKAHVGEVVTVGSTKVFINNFPAARMQDKIVEVAAPNATLFYLAWSLTIARLRISKAYLIPQCLIYCIWICHLR